MPRCPSCFTPLVRVEEQELKSAHCPDCFGTWISNQTLTRRVRLDIEQKIDAGDPATSLADLAEVVAASNSKEVLRCPECEKPMGKDRFHAMIPVTIDRCRHCASLWLDAAEMTLIRRLYRELMTSDDPELVHRREKLASVSAEWQARRADVQNAAEANFTSIDMDDTFNLLSHLLTP